MNENKSCSEIADKVFDKVLDSVNFLGEQHCRKNFFKASEYIKKIKSESGKIKTVFDEEKFNNDKIALDMVKNTKRINDNFKVLHSAEVVGLLSENQKLLDKYSECKSSIYESADKIFVPFISNKINEIENKNYDKNDLEAIRCANVAFNLCDVPIEECASNYFMFLKYNLRPAHIDFCKEVRGVVDDFCDNTKEDYIKGYYDLQNNLENFDEIKQIQISKLVSPEEFEVKSKNLMQNIESEDVSQ